MGIWHSRLLGLASILLVSHSCECLGQSVSAGSSTGTTPTLAIPLVSDSELNPTGTDQTNAYISGQASQNSLSSMNSQAPSAVDQAGQSATRSSTNRVAGASLFGMSPAFNAVPKTDSAFGVSDLTFRTEMTPAKPSASNGSFGERQSHGNKNGAASPASAKQLMDTAKAEKATSADMHTVSRRSVAGAKTKGSTSVLGSAGRPDEEGSDTSLTGVASSTGTASYSNSFPDSTEGTALLSPPDRNESPFQPLPNGLSFGFADLNQMVFLDPSFRGKSAGGLGSERESMYQKFLKLMQAERSSKPSNGLRTNPSVSPFSTPALGLQSHGNSGLKADSVLGQRSGTRSSMPF